MNVNLLKPREVDLIFRYPAGRTQKLAKAGKIPCVRLPDGEFRIPESIVQGLICENQTANKGGDNGE